MLSISFPKNLFSILFISIIIISLAGCRITGGQSADQYVEAWIEHENTERIVFALDPKSPVRRYAIDLSLPSHVNDASKIVYYSAFSIMGGKFINDKGFVNVNVYENDESNLLKSIPKVAVAGDGRRSYGFTSDKTLEQAISSCDKGKKICTKRYIIAFERVPDESYTVINAAFIVKLGTRGPKYCRTCLLSKKPKKPDNMLLPIKVTEL